MKREYTVISASDETDLIKQVMAHIANGWEPVGSVMVTVDKHGASSCFYQAMIR